MCESGLWRAPRERIVIDMFAGEEKLRRHAGASIEMQVEEVVPGIVCFRNFGSSNAVLIKGAKEAVMIDALESDGYAQLAQAYVDRPVKTLIYTHTHADHTGGAAVLGQDAEAIIAHTAQGSQPLGKLEMLKASNQQRMARQLGVGLTPEEVICLGIGPLMPAKGSPQPLAPTLLNDKEQYTLHGADRKMVLIAAPGETDDQQYVWLPEKRILCCGDNFYASFPNLYTIRGSQYRDVSKWVDSLDKLLALEPEIMVPGHGDIVRGQAQIREIIGAYREAIAYVLEGTLQRMNQGLSLQRIVDEVKLPAHLAEKPFLQEFYGTVEWSVRGIYTGYYGWFDGNAVRLGSLPEAIRAQKYVELAGGAEAMLAAARKAHEAGDYQWSAELCDHLLCAQIEDEAIRRLQADNFTLLGRMQTSANGRHYYLKSAQEILDGLD